MKKYVAIYTRVSTKTQRTESQEPELKAWAANQSLPVKWFRDKASGKNFNRKAWAQLENDMSCGKVAKLVCHKIDRLGRTARELLVLFDELRERKIDLVCVASGIRGLETSEGRLLAGIVAQFAEFDNEQRSERILDGQAEARKAGKKWGGSKRGRKIIPKEKIDAIKKLHSQNKNISVISRIVSISRPSIYKLLNESSVTA